MGYYGFVIISNQGRSQEFVQGFYFIIFSRGLCTCWDLNSPEIHRFHGSRGGGLAPIAPPPDYASGYNKITLQYTSPH